MSYSQNGIGYIRATFNQDLSLSENSATYANLLYPYLQDNGGNSQNTSLTVDIINQDFQNKYKKINQEWIINERNNANCQLDEFIWGFQETTNQHRKSKALSSAFCFNQQKLTFNIAKEGHIAGYIGEDFIYAKNTISIYIADLVQAKETLLTTFSDLQSDLNNSERFTTWEIPQVNTATFNAYGFFGAFVIKIKVESQFFKDASFKILTNYQNKVSNFYLQLLTYSASKEAQDVTSYNVDLFDTPAFFNDTFNTLFAKSIFDTLTQYNQNVLSTDQKRAIIADQIAVLFISQHPVITADLTPSKITGFGGEKAFQSQKILKKVITYAERYDPSIIELAQNRLFGMFANYKSFSFANEINKLFDQNNQSNQVIKDPSRILVLDENGYLSNEIGVDGILFAPYNLENQNTVILNNVQVDNVFNLPLYKYSVGIDTLNVTNDLNAELTCGEEKIKLSFNVVYGEEKISQIYYQTWIKNNLSYTEYLDANGTTTNHTFDFSSFGGILCTYSGSQLTKGDVVTARVSIIDISGFSNVFERQLFIPLNNSDPAFTEIRAYQRTDGSGLIDIMYRYLGTSEINPATIYLYYSKNNSSFSLVSSYFLGDAGSGIQPGYRKIVWNPVNILTASDDVVFLKLSLSDVDKKTNRGVGQTESNTVVVDLKTPIVAIRKLTIKEEINMNEESSSSESSSSSYSSESSSSTSQSSSSSS